MDKLEHHGFDKHRMAWTLKNFQLCDVMTNKLLNSMNNANGGQSKQQASLGNLGENHHACESCIQ
jgi:hypothetical protein